MWVFNLKSLLLFLLFILLVHGGPTPRKLPHSVKSLGFFAHGDRDCARRVLILTLAVCGRPCPDREHELVEQGCAKLIREDDVMTMCCPEMKSLE